MAVCMVPRHSMTMSELASFEGMLTCGAMYLPLQSVPHTEPIDLIKHVNDRIKHLVPPELRSRTPNYPCGGTVLVHMDDCGESFEDLIRLSKITPENEATVHQFQFSSFGEAQGICYWFCFVSSSRFLVGYSTCREEVSSHVSTVGEAVIPLLSHNRRIQGSTTRRLQTPAEFIEEWRLIVGRCVGQETSQDYINVPIVTDETDSILSKILISWSGSGMMAGANELGLRADGLTSTYWYISPEKDGHVECSVFGSHFGMHVLCLWVFVCLCGAIYRGHVHLFCECGSRWKGREEQG